MNSNACLSTPSSSYLSPANCIKFAPKLDAILLQGHSDGFLSLYDSRVEEVVLSTSLYDSVCSVDWFNSNTFVCSDNSGAVSCFDIRSMHEPTAAVFLHDGYSKVFKFGSHSIGSMGRDSNLVLSNSSLTSEFSNSFESMDCFGDCTASGNSIFVSFLDVCNCLEI
ncbi:hypothetical protein GEMRC1_002711 [Eukaryota sp. GEM-RC1]